MKEILQIINKNIDNDEFLYNFAIELDKKNILEQDILELIANIIIKHQNAEYIWRIANTFPQLSSQKLEQAIINTKDPKYIFFFATYNKPKSLINLTKRLIETGSGKYLNFMAMFTNNAPLELIKKGILTTNDACDIYEFYTENYKNDYSFIDRIIELEDIEVLTKCLLLPIDINKKQEILELLNKLYIEKQNKRKK